MVDIPPGTQIGVDGVRRPIAELPTNPASDYFTRSVFVTGALTDGAVPVWDADSSVFRPGEGGGGGEGGDVNGGTP